MSLSTSLVGIIYAVIWVVCILAGMGIGAFFCRYIGIFLGWMIANSLDENIIRGGQIGKQVGKLLGVIAGIGLGIYGAQYVVALLGQYSVH
jgi:putative Ca2+/H+ antiporter (TMEM165/GDT1 family)